MTFTNRFTLNWFSDQFGLIRSGLKTPKRFRLSRLGLDKPKPAKPKPNRCQSLYIYTHFIDIFVFLHARGCMAEGEGRVTLSISANDKGSMAMADGRVYCQGFSCI